jgi:hypothetical protein
MDRPNLDGEDIDSLMLDYFCDVIWTDQRHVEWVGQNEWLNNLDDDAYPIFWLLVMAAEGIL